MRFPASLINVYVFVIAALVASCSSNHEPVVETDTEEFIGIPLTALAWMPIPDDDGILVAILIGDPSKPGPLVARYDIPANREIAPHTHREVRSYTILSGVWELGFGETFDPHELQSFPQGSYYRLPAGVPHFQRAGPEGAVIQIESFGPDTFDLIE